MARIDPSATQPTPPVTSGPAPTPTPAPAPKPKKVLKKEAAPLAPPSESGWWVGKKPFDFEGKRYQPGHPVPNSVHEAMDPTYRDHLIKNDWFIGDDKAAGKLFHKTVNEASEQPIVDESLLRSSRLFDQGVVTPLRSDQLLDRLKIATDPEEQKKLVHELSREVGLDLAPYTVKTTKRNPTGINLVGVGRLLGAVTKSQTDIQDIVRHLDPATANTIVVAHAMVNLHSDAEAQLRHGEETGGASGKAWYEDDVDAMEAGLHQMVMADPKLAGLREKIGAVDETGRHVSRHDPLSHPTMGLLKVLIGITSGGNTPKRNMGVAMKVLEQALRDPRVLAGESPFAHLPTQNVERQRSRGAPKNFSGQPGVDVTGPKLSRLVSQFGEAGALKWLLTDHSGHEIRHFSGTDTELPDGVGGTYPGSFIFGQKLGPFVQNLFRRSTELTADRWFVRTWRRIMGDLTGLATDRGQTKEEVLDTPTPQMKRLMGIATKRVAASLGMSVSSLQAVLWYYEKRLWRAAGTSNPEESYADAVEKEIQRRGLPSFRRPRPTSDPGGKNADPRSAKPVPLHRRRGAGPLRSRQGPPSRYAAPIQAPGKSAIAWSPNVEENLDFGAAWDRMRSGNHKAFGEIADHVLKTVGLGDYKSHAAIGDWSDGAENSFAHVLSGPQDPEKVKYAASWLGLLANQKAVMAFHAADDGADRLYSITLKGTDATSVRKGLDAAGLQYRTIVPTRDGFHVLIYDEGAKSAPAIEQFAEAHDASVLETAGSGSFIGAGSRSEARRVYRDHIDRYETQPNSSRYRPPVRSSTPTPRPRSVYQMKRAGQPVRYAHVRAPAGGIVVRGVFYPGGKFIPTSEIEKATPEERQALEQKLGGAEGGQTVAPAGLGEPKAPPQSDPLSSRLSALAQAAASSPPALVQKAKSLIQARYQKLVERYGPKGAATVLVATALLTPVPVPGTSLLPIALAEGIKLAKAALSSRRLQPKAALSRQNRPIRYAGRRRDDLDLYPTYAHSFASDLRDAQEGYQAHLLTNPFDHSKRMEYADVLEEQDKSDLAARQRTMGERYAAFDDHDHWILGVNLKDAHQRLENPHYGLNHAERIYELMKYYRLGHEHWSNNKNHPDAPHLARVHEWLRDHFEALEPQTKTKGILKLARRVRYSMGDPSSDTDTEGSLSGPTTFESAPSPTKSKPGSTSRSVADSTSEWSPAGIRGFFKESDRLEPRWRDRVKRVARPRAPVNYTNTRGTFGSVHEVDWSKYDHDATVADHTQRYRDVLLHPESHLTRLHQERYDQSLSGLLSRFPPVAVARLHAHTRDYNFGKDTTDLLRQVQSHDPSFQVEEGETLGGLFHPDHGVYLDGDLSTDEGEHVGGKAEGIHAHELGHAIDGHVLNRLSDSGHWKRAWKQEILPGGLSNYATNNASEGFAEFVQALYASPLKAEQIERQFPLSSYLFKEWGLWPGSSHPNAQAPSTRPLQPADPAPRRRTR